MLKNGLLTLVVGFSLLAPGVAWAEVRAHALFSDNVVLQRGKPVHVWGWADAGEAIIVTFAGQSKGIEADRGGAWSVYLDRMEANSELGTLVIKGASNSVTCANVLVGDVWLCGGQSNMEHDLRSIYHGDVEILSANYPNIRLLSVPIVASATAVTNFEAVHEFSDWTSEIEQKGMWKICSPETVADFCGIGYFFGRRVHMVTQVPIALIDLSVGGTTVEAWTSMTSLERIPGSEGALEELAKRRAENVSGFDAEEDFEHQINSWERETIVRGQWKLSPPAKPEKPRTEPPYDGHVPGVYYNGMVAPLLGLTAKGILFNQGHNNAEANFRPAFYAEAFKAMIGDWRKGFDDLNLPFGIIAFVSGGNAQTVDNFELQMVDAAPYLREAQQVAYNELGNMGFTAAYDQQSSWYHPHRKNLLGERIARWALDVEYGTELGYKPARLVSAEREGSRYILTFSKALECAYENRRPIEGLAIAGADRHFYPARARFFVTGEDEHGREQRDQRRVEVWSDHVADPEAVRYAWARNPLGNLSNQSHMERMIPLPTFRTDKWAIPFGPESEEGKELAESWEWRQQMNKLRETAKAQVTKRKRQEADLLYKNTRE